MSMIKERKQVKISAGYVSVPVYDVSLLSHGVSLRSIKCKHDYYWSIAYDATVKMYDDVITGIEERDYVSVRKDNEVFLAIPNSSMANTFEKVAITKQDEQDLICAIKDTVNGYMESAQSYYQRYVLPALRDSSITK